MGRKMAKPGRPLKRVPDSILRSRVCLVVPPRQAVHPGRSAFLNFEKRQPEQSHMHTWAQVALDLINQQPMM
jgi:hypothetical protein